MNLRYRRLLYSVFIAAFLLATPLVILYTAGYRYNFKRWKIEKTGILYVDSNPKAALIYLNGQYRNKTPARFVKLLPDFYRVRVEKDGYYLWEKEIEIKSNLTTFSEDIVLFKKSLPINILEGQINLFAASSNQEKIFYSAVKNNREELRVLVLKNETDFLISALNRRLYKNLEFLGWSPNQNQVLIGQTSGDLKKYSIINLDNFKTRDLTEISRLNFDRIDWNQTNNNYLYGLKGLILYQIDLVKSSAEIIINEPISDFQTSANAIYYTTKISGEYFLNKRALNFEGLSLPEKIKLPDFADFALLPAGEGCIILHDSKKNDLYIIKADSFNETKTDTNPVLEEKAKKIAWTNDFKNLLYYTDFEIWSFNLSDQKKTLITRLGSPIGEAIWYPGNKYIIYRLGKAIYAIEAGDFEAKNNLKLFELNEIQDLALDREGKNLYLKGKAGNQPGLYKFELQ